MMTLTTTYCKSSSKFREQGFTLVEIAIVLVIVGVMLGSLLGPVSKQQALKNTRSTEAQLQEIHDALIGYAALNGFLPCPASAVSNGAESRVGNVAGANCTLEHGFVPSNTLGRYSLNDAGTWEFAKSINLQSGPATFSIRSVADSDPATTTLASNVIAVIYSLGADRDTSPASANQGDNLDSDDQFVSTTPSEATGSEYDDLVTWISPNTLALHLVKSGKLNGF